MREKVKLTMMEGEGGPLLLLLLLLPKQERRARRAEEKDIFMSTREEEERRRREGGFVGAYRAAAISRPCGLVLVRARSTRFQ
jgi:hypothetical protein